MSAASTAVVRGEEDVGTWDWEELRRGRKRSANGRFNGPDPKVIPRPCFEEMYRRVISVAEREMLEALPRIVDALLTIIDAPDVDDATRLRAVQYAMDRTMGKAEDRVRVEANIRQQPWEHALQVAIVGEVEDTSIVDAEVVEDDDEVMWEDV